MEKEGRGGMGEGGDITNNFWGRILFYPVILNYIS